MGIPPNPRLSVWFQGASMSWAILVVLITVMFVAGQTLADLRNSDRVMDYRVTRMETAIHNLEDVPYDIKQIKIRLGIKGN